VTVSEDGSNVKEIEKLLKEEVKAGRLVGVTFAKTGSYGRPRLKETAVPFPTKLTREQLDGITRIAAKEKVSKVAVIRRAISELLDRENKTEKIASDG